LNLKGTNERIHPEYPFLKSEISYAVKNELAEKPNDVLCRRVPIAFLDSKAAQDLLPEVIEIMAKEKSWSAERIK
jgi:glycerol-3-phosphate dehydrogenase